MATQDLRYRRQQGEGPEDDDPHYQSEELGGGGAKGCFGCLLVGIFLLILSFGSLSPVEYGVIYNGVTKQIDGRAVYRGGLHLIGFWNSFITFPSTTRNIEFSNAQFAQSGPLSTRTKEGLSLNLYISFQYRLIQAEVVELYQMANKLYEPVFIQNARDVLLRAAADYEASEYWVERAKVGAEMHDLLKKRLETSHAEVLGVQLLVIELPDKYEESIVLTQVRKQLRRTREMEQLAATTRASTQVKIAEFERSIKVLLQGGEANRTLAGQLAEAEAARKTIEAEAKAVAYAKQKLSLSSTQMVEYQRNAALFDLDNATFLYGLGGTNVMLGNV